MPARRRAMSRLRRCPTSAAAALTRGSARRSPGRRGPCLHSRPRAYKDEYTLPKRLSRRAAARAHLRCQGTEKVTDMRKLIISILLASAVASPALAQNRPDRGRHDQSQADREQAREIRQQSRESRQQAQEAGRQAQEEQPQG